MYYSSAEPAVGDVVLLPAGLQRPDANGAVILTDPHVLVHEGRAPRAGGQGPGQRLPTFPGTKRNVLL